MFCGVTEDFIACPSPAPLLRLLQYKWKQRLEELSKPHKAVAEPIQTVKSVNVEVRRAAVDLVAAPSSHLIRSQSVCRH
jgi:hypothetical protein